jgi:putative component of toxin-antitoxin plasmid stabilization module
MPETTVLFYQDDDGQVPVLEWLRGLQRRDRKAYAKCVARIRRLAILGHELRRPEADFLREGIYELRTKKGRVNYRILYFFHGRNVAILGHALTKEDKVPDADIRRAIRCKEAFERDPAGHSYEGDLGND